jgi:hypothetical protein
MVDRKGEKNCLVWLLVMSAQAQTERKVQQNLQNIGYSSVHQNKASPNLLLPELQYKTLLNEIFTQSLYPLVSL